MRNLADFYRQFNFNVIPLGGDKRPIIVGAHHVTGQALRFKWRDWERTPQTNLWYKSIRSKPWWKEAGGVATSLGVGSGGLVNVDFDSQRKYEPEAPPIERSVIDAFVTSLGLPADYAWISTTPTGGWHVWALCPDLKLDKASISRAGVADSVDHIELRYTGSYTVLPGSRHPDYEERYAFAGDRPTVAPATVNAETILAAYNSVTVEEEPKTPHTQQTPTGTQNTGDTPYALAALVAEANNVQRAAQGARNDELNRAAFVIGQLTPHELSEQTALDALLSAGLHAGLDEDEVMATIRSGLASGQAEPRYPESRINGTNGNGYAHGYDADTPDLWGDSDGDEADTWPYTVYKDHLCIIQEDKEGNTVYNPIADFYAMVKEEVHDEDGEIEYLLHGKSTHGGIFTVSVGAHVFGKDNELRAVLEAASGPQDPVRPRMTPHLGPAIKLLSRTQTITRQKLYRRTGWAGRHFLLPGRVEEGTLIDLPRKLPYGGDPGNLCDGLEALRSLLESITPLRSTPIVAMLLQAPMHRLADWHNERYGIFVQGRTGSLKTSFAQTAMCLYGAGFAHDDLLIKWGEGATRNAIMAMAAHAHDMPLLIDNYKPNTGGGSRDFVNLIHNILEGGEKDRLTRNATLRDTKPVHVFPLVTGEDVPDEDPASLARVLVTSLEWQHGQSNDALANAQRLAKHLPAVGESWIAWLESEEGRQAAIKISSKLPEVRARWSTLLQSRQAHAVNILRIATNLATNELVWQMACEHPVLGPLLLDYSHDHYEGLVEIAQVLADRTSTSLEAQQFASGLRELLMTKQYILIPRGQPEPMDIDRDRMLGWYDFDGLYLLPKVSMRAVKNLLGHGSLPISPQALYTQMHSLGWLTVTGKDVTTRSIRVAGQVVRVLHLSASILAREDEPETEKEILESLGI